MIGLLKAGMHFGKYKLKFDMRGRKKMIFGVALSILAIVPACKNETSQMPMAGLQKIKKARLEVENARLEADENRRLLELDVQQALQQLKDGYQLVLSAETALKHAEENLRVTTNRYEASMAVLSDLLDAQTRKQQAESDLIEAKAQYKIDETNYKYSIGCL